jgi:hypothetical protein
MLGAGTIINPLIKIVTTVAVLAAAYFFIVRPVLDTTDKAIDSVGGQIEKARAGTGDAFRNAEVQSARSRTESFAQSLQSSWPAASREVRGCLRKAGEELPALKRCDGFAEKLVHTVQSDRSFALSYATSIAAQGDAAGANRVQACVKQAGFAPAAMQRCRDLADQLLFG